MNNFYDSAYSHDWKAIQDIGPMTHTRYRLVLKELPPYLPSGSRIIDIGCGIGTLLSILKKRYPGADLSGIEYSEVAVNSAPPHIRNCIRAGDIVELAPELSTHPYDIVICTEVLEHIPEPSKALDSIVSLLKPGGIALFTVPAGMMYWSSQDTFAGHLRRFKYLEFRNLLTDSGLKIEHCYGWGICFGLIYDRLISTIGPSKVANYDSSHLSKIASRFVFLLLHFDDLFPCRLGFQLVAKARRPSRE